MRKSMNGKRLTFFKDRIFCVFRELDHEAYLLSENKRLRIDLTRLVEVYEKGVRKNYLTAKG